MKIATMVRGSIPAPRPKDMVYAPIDLAVAISEHLTQRGHKVDYFGPNGTRLECAGVETLNLRTLVHNREEFLKLLYNTDHLFSGIVADWDNYLSREMFERARNGEYDLLHFHHPETAFPYVHLYPDVPVVFTIHDPLSPTNREIFEMYSTKNQYFISISNNQRLPAPDLNYADTVYNGIDTELFSYSDEKDDYLLTAARIAPEKGIKEAIQVAQETDHRLLIIGPVYAEHQDYFDKHVKPHLNEKILYLEFVEREQLVRYFQKAKAFLMIPIDRDEPFGLTMIEAMACGTPVIGMRRGSIPEVIKDKKTGFIVDTVHDMAQMVKKISKIKAADCRKHVEDNFSHITMVNGYEKTFEKIIKDFKKQCEAEPSAIK